MTAFLLSWLANRYAALDASIFLREQPGAWLVLERERGGPSRAAEPVALRLARRRDRVRLTLGRDPASDLVVDEPTVAPAHVVLEGDAEGNWTLRRADAGARATLDGLEVGDFAVHLGSGARIGLGDARLTFYGGADFHARLRDHG